ncbi:MAG: hypothetical protein Q9175_000849 [Cornicularia normoerica]
MSPRKVTVFASNSNDRKGSDLLLDLEDLGKVLKTCSPNQERKSDHSQTPNGKDCQSCDRKDTCETAVQASSQLIEQGRSVSGEEAQHTKDQEMINPIRKPMRKQPKVHDQTSKQEAKTAILKTI